MRIFDRFIYRGPDEDMEESELIYKLETSGVLAVDTETVNTKDYTCLGIGLYVNDREGFYFRTFPDASPYLPLVMSKLGDDSVTKIYHNGQDFDIPVLEMLAENEGYSRPDIVNFQDSELLAKVAGLPGSLQRVGEEWLNVDGLFSIQDLMAEFNTKSMLDVPWERLGEKCLNDCRVTWKMFDWLQGYTNSAQKDCYEVDRQIVPVLRKMQDKGLGLRQGVLLEYKEKLQRDILKLVRQCDIEGFHPGSGMQVGYVLASRGNMLPLTDSKKQLKTSEDVLEELDDPLADIILDYRGKAKLLSTYIEPWIGKERAYTHFRLNLATGRLASGAINSWDSVNRNLQNVPPDVREVFRPDSGEYTWADHGQIELRVLAFVSKDSVMMSEYAKPDPDLHTMTANAGGVSRGNGKTFNFAKVYGASDKMLKRKTGVELSKVKEIGAAWNELFPGASSWIRNQQYNHNGEWVEDLFGRRMRLPEPNEHTTNMKAFQAHVGKCAVNYPIQGAAANIVKRGMLMIDKSGVDMRIQLHDEYLVDGKWEPEPGLAWVHPELHTPFETKGGISWK